MVSRAALGEFKAKAQAAGAEVERFQGKAQALRFVSRFMAAQRLKRLAAAPDAASYVPKGRDWELLRPSSLSGYAEAEVGLVRADRGIVATGTVVHWDKGDEDRIVWTLPPVCLCILRERDIVPDQDDLAASMVKRLSPRTEPGFSQVSFVTGPSRTADIEGELSLGVHGPGRLIILLIKS